MRKRVINKDLRINKMIRESSKRVDALNLDVPSLYKRKAGRYDRMIVGEMRRALNG